MEQISPMKKNDDVREMLEHSLVVDSYEGK